MSGSGNDKNAATVAHGSRLPQSFTKKRIDVTFKIASGALGPSAVDDTVTLTGLRCRATINIKGMNPGSFLALRIEGMTLSMMNRLSVVVGLPSAGTNNTQLSSNCVVTVQAGDDVSGMSTVFMGQIFEAFVDFTGAPNVAFQLSANDALPARRTLTPVTSFAGTVPVTTIFSELAYKAAGLKTSSDAPVQGSGAFVGHGLTETVTNYYGCGTAMEQIDALARSIQAFHCFDTSGTLHVWSQHDKSDQDATTVRISRLTGLIGYPAYIQGGVSLTTLFNPAIQIKVPFGLKSEYQPAGWVDNQMGQALPRMPSTGVWRPMTITHDLASEIPNGPWFTQITAVANNSPVVRKPS